MLITKMMPLVLHAAGRPLVERQPLTPEKRVKNALEWIQDFKGFDRKREFGGKAESDRYVFSCRYDETVPTEARLERFGTKQNEGTGEWEIKMQFLMGHFQASSPTRIFDGFDTALRNRTGLTANVWDSAARFKFLCAMLEKEPLSVTLMDMIKGANSWLDQPDNQLYYQLSPEDAAKYGTTRKKYYHLRLQLVDLDGGKKIDRGDDIRDMIGNEQVTVGSYIINIVQDLITRPDPDDIAMTFLKYIEKEILGKLNDSLQKMEGPTPENVRLYDPSTMAFGLLWQIVHDPRPEQSLSHSRIFN